MTTRKKRKNTYLIPARQLAWNALSAVEQQAFIDQARANYNLSRTARARAQHLSTDELRELLAVRLDEEQP